MRRRPRERAHSWTWHEVMMEEGALERDYVAAVSHHRQEQFDALPRSARLVGHAHGMKAAMRAAEGMRPTQW